MNALECSTATAPVAVTTLRIAVANAAAGTAWMDTVMTMSEEPYVDQFGRAYTELTEQKLSDNMEAINAIIYSIVESYFLDEPLTAIEFLDQLEDYIMADPDLPFYLPTDTNAPVCKRLMRAARSLKASFNG